MKTLTLFFVAAVALPSPTFAQDPKPIEYQVLATTRTSTMEKELNQVADAGFRFQAVMGGETAGGGKETVCVTSRPAGDAGRYRYRLLAASRTGTMQKEIQQAADEGFEVRGQTVFETLLGNREVVIVMELDRDHPAAGWQYRLLSTTRTSTMGRELNDLGELGFQIVGMAVGETLLGGKELISITRRMR